MQRQTFPPNRIFVLGAGFSCLAGLPTAAALFSRVMERIREDFPYETKVDRDLRSYTRYCQRTTGVRLKEKDINLEDFMSFLDLEHFLQLRGSDAWSDEGNEAQLMIRMAIGQVIHAATPRPEALPNAYYEFARRLSPGDTVITFNYDLVLERALGHLGKRYRRFPDRLFLDNEGRLQSPLDDDEIVILKLHGSVDWFDDRVYLQLVEQHGRMRLPGRGPKHAVFGPENRFDRTPVSESYLEPDDQIGHIHQISKVDAFYGSDAGFVSPYILSPSKVKFVYASPLLSLWRGLGRVGQWNLGLSIIGFSLPGHDAYIRILLYKLSSHFQSYWARPALGRQKDFIKVVDLRRDTKSYRQLRRTYAFLPARRTKYFATGFDAEAVDFLFTNTRL